jgi:hypothetical protein
VPKKSFFGGLTQKGSTAFCGEGTKKETPLFQYMEVSYTASYFELFYGIAVKTAP